MPVGTVCRPCSAVNAIAISMTMTGGLAMITLHQLSNARVQRIARPLEERDVPDNIKRYLRDAKTMQAPPELLAARPLGKSPALCRLPYVGCCVSAVSTEGELAVAESGAIIESLFER